MDSGYDHPLYILPFDHRSSFVRGLFGFTEPLTASQTTEIAASKKVIYDAFEFALSRGVPRQPAVILADERFGVEILRDAAEKGVITCFPVEKSCQEEFRCACGNRWRVHVAAMRSGFVKVLVRYNPEGDQALNRRQRDPLKAVSDYCRRNGGRFLFELLVPMTREPSTLLGNDRDADDRDLRTRMMIGASEEIQDAGVEPDVWKVDGLERRADCAAIVEAARRRGRSRVGCAGRQRPGSLALPSDGRCSRATARLLGPFSPSDITVQPQARKPIC